MATGATHIMCGRILLPAAPRLAPQVVAALARCARRGPGRSEGVPGPAPESTTGGPGSGSSKVPSRLPRPCRSSGHSPPRARGAEQGAAQMPAHHEAATSSGTLPRSSSLST